MAYTRNDCASAGAMEFRRTGILFPRVEMGPTGAWVYADCNPDGSMFFQTSAGEVHQLGPRIPDNPIVPRWLPNDNEFGVFYCALVNGQSAGKIAYVDQFGHRTEVGTFDASQAGSQGIRDVQPDGLVAFVDLTNTKTVDGILVMNWRERGNYIVCTSGPGGELGYGVAVYSPLDLGKWFKASDTIVQLLPGIAQNGTVAVSGDPGGFVTREEWLTRPFDPHAPVEPPEPGPEPPIPGPEPPNPTPEDDMIAYGPKVPGFLPGELVNHPDGSPYVGIRKPNGKVVACTPDGNLEERDAMGAWERFVRSKNGATLVADRGEGRVYIFPLSEW